MKQYIAKVLPLIEKAVEKHFPKDIDDAWVDSNMGKHSYSFDFEAWREAIHGPFYELYSRGGKRLRPVLCCLVYEALGGSSADIYDIAIIPEILHTGSLIIDDIEDNSELRRGGKVVHKIYGEAVSINAGNFLYFIPFQILNNIPVDDDKKAKIQSVLAEEMVRLHLGQGMDNYWSTKAKYDIGVQEYLQMCEYKTGCMVTVALKLGAIMAGVNDKMPKLRELASNVGIAFQIRDDILNLKPTSEWGKDTGEDITEGKLTYMVAHTMSVASDEDKKELIKILSSNTKDKDEIKKAIDILEKNNAFDNALEFANNLLNKSKDIVRDVFDDSEQRKVFLEMIDYIVERNK